MAMIPGRYYIHSAIRLTIKFYDSDETDVDPDGVVCKTLSPSGVETSYTYGVTDGLGRVDAGDYYLDFVPNESGRWHFRWESSDDGVTYDIAEEGNFLVQHSAFYDGTVRAYGR